MSWWEKLEKNGRFFTITSYQRLADRVRATRFPAPFNSYHEQEERDENESKISQHYRINRKEPIGAASGRKRSCIRVSVRLADLRPCSAHLKALEEE